ncbi:hypothetical protein CEXT_767531 [Caerostris extrusa]|uniref:Uncharacterized protein n=1 Tax=Caerostris extrusa TaxID=172846 RepID=A0AAV4XN05_CAEEX|nr:hypothetical protein CEXT_767531 [Caerostris extrusa]
MSCKRVNDLAGSWPDFPGDARSEEGRFHPHPHPHLCWGLGLIRDVPFFFFFLFGNGLKEISHAFIGKWYQVGMETVGSSLLSSHNRPERYGLRLISLQWILPGNRLTMALGLSAGRWPDFPGEIGRRPFPPCLVGVLEKTFKTPPSKHLYLSLPLIPVHSPQAIRSSPARFSNFRKLLVHHHFHLAIAPRDTDSGSSPCSGYTPTFVGVLGVIRDAIFFLLSFWEIVCRKSTVSLLVIGVKLEWKLLAHPHSHLTIAPRDMDSGSSPCSGYFLVIGLSWPWVLVQAAGRFPGRCEIGRGTLPTPHHHHLTFVGVLGVVGINRPSQNPQDFETPPSKHPYLFLSNPVHSLHVIPSSPARSPNFRKLLAHPHSHLTVAPRDMDSGSSPCSGYFLVISLPLPWVLVQAAGPISRQMRDRKKAPPNTPPLLLGCWE